LNTFTNRHLPWSVSTVVWAPLKAAVLAVVAVGLECIAVDAVAFLSGRITAPILAAVRAVLDLQSVDVYVAEAVRTIQFVAGVSMVPVVARAARDGTQAIAVTVFFALGRRQEVNVAAVAHVSVDAQERWICCHVEALEFNWVQQFYSFCGICHSGLFIGLNLFINLGLLSLQVIPNLQPLVSPDVLIRDRLPFGVDSCLRIACG